MTNTKRANIRNMATIMSITRMKMANTRRVDTTRKDSRSIIIRKREDPIKDITVRIIRDIKIKKDTNHITRITISLAKRAASMAAVNMDSSMVGVVVGVETITNCLFLLPAVRLLNSKI
jgi:TRAP-type uncharacterized transport system fused permease subunit